MSQIKFGTDGWRAIIADDFTVENVARVAAGTALWLKQKGGDKVVIGHDCRFAGQLFAETATRVLGAYGIKVHLAKGFVSTPMVSLGVVKTKSDAGVVITASHNPPDYNGYKLKSYYGGPTAPEDIATVEALVPAHSAIPTLPTLTQMVEDGLLNYIDLESMYLHEVRAHFDLDAINASGIRLAHDAMYGASQNVVRQLLHHIVSLHSDYNPSFMGQAPEPIHRNLTELSELIKHDPTMSAGLANDGDADRIGMYDHEGNFVDSNHILLLLIHYLHHYKGLNGMVIITFSVTDKVKKICEHYGLECRVTKIGFKYIADLMTREDVLVGGEESGGIAAKGFVPERDGIWIGLILLEFMAKTGKSLRALIEEVYRIVGSFDFQRNDLHLDNAKKDDIIQRCRNRAFPAFGSYGVKTVEDLDGYKFHVGDGEWVLVRPSGTEPLLRVYAQAATAELTKTLLDAACKTLLA